MIKYFLVIAVYSTFGSAPEVGPAQKFDDKQSCAAAGKEQVVKAKADYAHADYTCYRRKVRAR